VAFWQTIVYVEGKEIPDMVCVPLGSAFVPLHAPLATQEVGELDVVQEILKGVEGFTTVGAVKVHSGVGTSVIVKLKDARLLVRLSSGEPLSRMG